MRSYWLHTLRHFWEKKINGESCPCLREPSVDDFGVLRHTMVHMTTASATEPCADLLSARQLAQKFNLHPKTIHRWAAAGLFPTVRLSARTVRFPLGDVQRLVSNSTYRSTPALDQATGGER